MTPSIPLTRDLVLIGGGHTHALVLRRWGMDPLPGVRLTLINPGPTAPYSGMLPGFVAGHYAREDLDIDLVQLARFAGARLIAGAATALDVQGKTITVEGRPPVAFDVASVDVGITSAMPALDGFAQHGIPAKPLGPFATKWEAFRANATEPKVAVIGGGVAGAELAMAMAHALRDRAPEITLLDRGRALEQVNAAARQRLLRAMAEQGVHLIENAEVRAVAEDHVLLSDGRRIASGFTTGAAGARPQGWLAHSGLDTEDGFLTVGPSLQTSDPSAFAVGDCAHLSHAPRPKAGVFAVREAPYLYDNLRAALSGGRMRRYRPQKDYLKLISLGAREALAERFGTARRGRLLWRWKDHIDRTFMAKFDALPTMQQKLPKVVAEGVRQITGDAPLCAGCGAKVGRGALQDVLAGITPHGRDDILSTPGDDAAVLRTGGATQVFTTDHLSAVTKDPVLMAKIATLHALGDIWAMGAAPQAAVLSLTVPRMAPELQRRTVGEITTTVSEVLQDAGAALVGGHTTMGDGLTIGLSLTGLLDGAAITLAGARLGDVIVLSKPVGSGTILAAEMRGQARGQDVLSCYDWMVRSNAPAARSLAQARAMTDVTGFGLAGHLAGICEASGVGAVVDLDAVPLMRGALDLAEAGVRSSIYADNRADWRVTAPDTPRAALMFDPQTSGGLLAVLDRTEAERLAAMGAAALTPIGEITEGTGVTFR
ncbi:selenide, water dikinase SelD [Thalassorhabdomicrobium marinisediminis]|uniref:Selenide, water dikinase SelD n=1 Tax=Thalassorhabdomicrobium marinisediminis TaxID=2170577 RepID=A0A2T7FVQ8_9RHOB|nr:selenide, water dikinase SelD [Thalassorhabdomicrobium marinisediminis]PVA06237.1 selenide, water dikinase SelD [Thalassorhabdomicrobium marinisediminis]